MTKLTSAERQRNYRERHPERVAATILKYKTRQLAKLTERQSVLDESINMPTAEQYARDPERHKAHSLKAYTKGKVKALAYMAQRKRDNKIKAVAYLGGKCVACDGVFDACAYDFHHKDPREKDINPARLLDRCWEKITIEIDKCELLCANCHRTLHYKEYSK